MTNTPEPSTLVVTLVPMEITVTQADCDEWKKQIEVCDQQIEQIKQARNYLRMKVQGFYTFMESKNG